MEYLEFLPGFHSYQDSPPNSTILRNGYNVSYLGAYLNGRKTYHGTFYDWTCIINIIFQSLDLFDGSGNFECRTIETLNAFFKTYPGWGLVASLLPTNLKEMYMRSLKSIRRMWDPEEEDFTETKCWILVMKKSLDQLVPEVNVTFTDDVTDSSGRKKIVTLMLFNRWGEKTLVVKFAAEKKIGTESTNK